MTFGQAIRSRRCSLELTAQSVHKRILKTGGAAISSQYFSDIEHGKRVPQRWMMKPLAKALKLSEDYLFYLAGLWPQKERKLMSEREFTMRLDAFRRVSAKKIMWNLGADKK